MEARALLASFVLAALAAQAFVGVVEARAVPMEKTSQGEDVKKPDCVPGVDPHTFPGIGGHGGGITPVPSHGGGSGYVPTPSHGSTGGALPTPAHGGGSSSSSPSTGGGYGGGSPSHGSSPSSGGGAYGGSPSTPGGGGAYGSDTPAPAFGDSPSHGGIGTSTPTPFVPVDPHSLGSLPGSCDYWRSHPMEIWSALGSSFPGSSSMSHFFGGAAGGVGGADVSIVDALGNTRSDGAGALLREGAAALLNSMTRAGFPYTTAQVRDAFAAAAAGGSDGAAAAQAAAFKKANEAGKA